MEQERFEFNSLAAAYVGETTARANVFTESLHDIPDHSGLFAKPFPPELIEYVRQCLLYSPEDVRCEQGHGMTSVMKAMPKTEKEKQKFEERVQEITKEFNLSHSYHKRTMLSLNPKN